ncbi:uncharacterized protein LOC110847573 isoform X2 [Folsomia candida]|uniref:uncharacterized protein LOC110847573 isoform X2 n=1 Tax=Folsomia candida TaxID=158441 RepID=UPI001604E956|nr:uncharacterized protein LOC110847573 isoform X2 [Folsomia candida]
MEILRRACRVPLFIALSWCLLMLYGSHFVNGESERLKRGIKDAVSKDSSGYSPGRDGKVQALTTRLETVESKLETMEAAETEILRTLQDGFKNISQREEKMEDKIKNISQKIQDVEVSLDTDENYWNYSTVCGGIMISQAGKIAYTEPFRIGATYTKASCVWTIRTNYRSKIHIQVTSFSPVIVSELLLSDDGSHTVNHTTVGSSRNYIFNGPVIFVTSPTRSLSMTYSGHGKLIHENVDFQHHYVNNANGSFNLNERSASQADGKLTRVLSTFVAKIDPSNLVELSIVVPKTCQNSSFYVQTGDDDFETSINNSSSCCLENPCNIRRYTLDGWFSTSHSTLLPNHDTMTLHWKSRTNQSDSIDKCGGIIMGKGGRISYKKFSTYRNNERCVWVIYPFPKKAIKFLQFSSSFETTYDHLTVLEVDKDNVESTSLSAPLTLSTMKNYTGRVLLVTFYTDTSIARQGFELNWEAVGPSYFTRSLDSEKILHNSFKDSDTNHVSLLHKGFAIYVMTNRELDGGSLAISARRKQGQNCVNGNIKIIGTSSGHIDNINLLTTNPCTNPAVWNVSSPDGIGFILLENKDAQGGLELDVSWNFVAPETTDVNAQDKCGGVIHGASGRLSYKLDSLYENGERCIWLIHSQASSEIQLKLVKEGFELCCDYVLVNTVDTSTGQMNNLTITLTRENNTRVFPGNLVIVSFRSDASVTGKGFVLEYTGRGQVQHPHKYTLIHLDEVLGSYYYQRQPGGSADGWFRNSENNNDEEVDENELTIIAYSTQTDAGDNTLLVFNVTIEDTVFGVDENCKFDSLNFYTTPSREGFTLGESYPKLECETTLHGCGNCSHSKLVGNDTTPHTFSSSFRTFVGIYKPVRSSVITNQTFHIRWDTSSGCGGIEHQEEGAGRITYKLNAKYKNLEQCIWTVYIANAAKIRFLLVSNGFEACCDNIILSSLDPIKGSIGTSAILKSGSISAIMNGPVVFVVFRTDASVTGEGFSLSYTSLNNTSVATTIAPTSLSLLSNDSSSEVEETSPTQLPTINYYHYHFHRRNSSFTYPFGRRTSLGVNDILTITFSPEPYKNESFLRFGTAVSIKELNLYVNNETCISDSLRFYETLTVAGFNASRSYSIPTSPNSNNSAISSCDEVGDEQWVCDNCFPNTTTTGQRTVSTTYPAFLAIYKSVTLPREREKRFKIEWADLQRADTLLAPTTQRSVGYYGR